MRPRRNVRLDPSTPSGDDDPRAAERDEGENRKLPVPVDPRPGEVRDENRRSDRNEGAVAMLHGEDERKSEEGDHERQPDRPELGKHLQIEAVGVPNRRLVRAFARASGAGSSLRPSR